VLSDVPLLGTLFTTRQAPAPASTLSPIETLPPVQTQPLGR